MKDEIEKRHKRKTRQIGWACEVMNRASDVICLIDKHMPQRIADVLFHAYWWIDAKASNYFCRAYEGSWEEIRDAWDHADETWLSRFQKMVVNERILPLPY